METQSEVEKKIKARVYKTKGKQGKSDSWNNSKIVVVLLGEKREKIKAQQGCLCIITFEIKGGEMWRERQD